MLGRGARNDLGDPARPGVEDVVELEFEDGGGLVDGAEDGQVRGRVEVLRQEVGDQGGRVRRLLGGLRVAHKLFLSDLDCAGIKAQRGDEP